VEFSIGVKRCTSNYVGNAHLVKLIFRNGSRRCLPERSVALLVTSPSALCLEANRPGRIQAVMIQQLRLAILAFTVTANLVPDRLSMIAAACRSQLGSRGQ
jgi:hypothetical protein